MKSFFVPVAKLSDADLVSLSAELVEAYQRNGSEDEYWLDSEGEDRYYEMQAEIHRRFRRDNPDWRPATPEWLTTVMTDTLRGMTIQVAKSFNSGVSPKIGDTIHVRRPEKFVCR